MKQLWIYQIMIKNTVLSKSACHRFVNASNHLSMFYFFILFYFFLLIKMTQFANFNVACHSKLKTIFGDLYYCT